MPEVCLSRRIALLRYFIPGIWQPRYPRDKPSMGLPSLNFGIWRALHPLQFRRYRELEGIANLFSVRSIFRSYLVLHRVNFLFGNRWRAQCNTRLELERVKGPPRHGFRKHCLRIHLPSFKSRHYLSDSPLVFHTKHVPDSQHCSLYFTFRRSFLGLYGLQRTTKSLQQWSLPMPGECTLQQ